jgi:DNA-binding MarR family transcriptional regulator
MTSVVDFAKVEKKTAAAVRSRNGANKHEYFKAVAQVRYVLRKVFRMVDEQARKFDLESLSHQALLQVYGSDDQKLRVSELAERLDIAPAFASNLIKALIKRNLLSRESDASDLRVTMLNITPTGIEICNMIDAEVRPHVNYFTSQLSMDDRETALSTLVFYMGSTAAPPRRKSTTR